MDPSSAVKMVWAYKPLSEWYFSLERVSVVGWLVDSDFVALPWGIFSWPMTLDNVRDMNVYTDLHSLSSTTWAGIVPISHRVCSTICWWMLNWSKQILHQHCFDRVPIIKYRPLACWRRHYEREWINCTTRNKMEWQVLPVVVSLCRPLCWWLWRQVRTFKWR